MTFNPHARLIYLISSGQTSLQTTRATKDFSKLLRLIETAVESQIDLIQIREKQLTAKMLYELTEAAVGIAQGSSTQILVNDRPDIALGAGAQGVHLATNSLAPDVVRATFGHDFLIGVSTHSLEQALAAKLQGADFVVLGPIFETSSKREFGEPLGTETLRSVSAELSPFPVLALGGMSIHHVGDCVNAGAAGIAAIGMFSDTGELARTVVDVRKILA